MKKKTTAHTRDNSAANPCGCLCSFVPKTHLLRIFFPILIFQGFYKGGKFVFSFKVSSISFVFQVRDCVYMVVSLLWNVVNVA